MVGDGGAQVPELEPSSSPRGVQALLPPPGQIQGWWWVLGCLAGPRLLERARTSCSKCRNTPGVTLDPSTAEGRGSSNGGRRAGVAEGHALGTQAAGPTLPQSRQLSPPHPCPKRPNATCRLGSEQPRESRKSKRRQLLNHGSPFIAQPSRARPPPQLEGQRHKRLPQGSA